MAPLLQLGHPGGSGVKTPSSTQKTWVQPLGWENPLEEGMATHSSILAWKIPWTEELGKLWSMGLQSRTRLKQLGIDTFVSMNEWISIHHYELKTMHWIGALRFPLLLLDALSLAIRITCSYHISLGSSWLCWFPDVACFLMILTVLRGTGGILLDAPPPTHTHWDLADIFLMIGLELWVWGGRPW